MFCSMCGKEISDQEEYCKWCGSRNSNYINRDVEVVLNHLKKVLKTYTVDFFDYE